MSNYKTVALGLSPDSYWELDENSGTNFVDSGGAGKNLTLTGSGASLAVSTGMVGLPTGCDFGNGAYARIGSALTQVATNKFSIGGWFFVRSGHAGGTEPLFCASYSGGHVSPYYTFMLADEDIDWRAVAARGSFSPFDGGSGAHSLYSAWHHYFLVYDGSNLKVYVDASLDYNPAATGNVDNMGSFAIGNIPALNDPSYSPDFKAAGVGYWHDTALSSTNITDLYNAASSAGGGGAGGTPKQALIIIS